MTNKKHRQQEWLSSKIKAKEIIVHLKKGKRAKDYIEEFNFKILNYLLFMPYCLPIIAVVVIFLVTGDSHTLLAIPYYLIFPVFLGNSQIVLGLFSIIGFYGVSKHWSPLYIALLLPAILSNIGFRIYQRTLEFIVLKRVLNSWDDALQLEKEGCVVFSRNNQIIKINERFS